jgi:mRNA interferase RelE/StbE
MTLFRVRFTKSAKKYYDTLSSKKQEKVKEIIIQLRQNPYNVANVKPLEGSKHDDFRMRIGSLRLLYRVDKGYWSRGDIYK